MSTEEVKALWEHYCYEYDKRYYRFPLQATGEDMRDLDFVFRRAQHDFEFVKNVISNYLKLDGEDQRTWFKQQGHSIKTLRSKLDFLYAYTAEKTKGSDKQWVTGFQADGEPIIEKESRSHIAGIVPVELDKWLRYPVDRKFIVPKERWEKQGVDTHQWALLWQERGYLPTAN